MAAEEIIFHDEAAAEYDAAFDWYLARSREAAFRFDTEVNHALQQIVENPRRWAVGASGTRRHLVRKFPFLLIYREMPQNRIQFVAVAHTSRKPGFWKQRI
ncbi:MAG TPA: type II toxin-antitoxin system RelE/ParE family toxin [Terriglobales bacterium]|nr:type II toxin-antitoxin system RelE/ParE family toxin [Terriglobales bacterium]